MMHSVLKRFRDYPPIQAFVNDSVLGRNYMSAESFSINAMLWKRYSRRFFDETEDSIVRPLKVGDYMNVLHLNDYRGQYLYVDFWASWCEPCLQQIPNIKMAAQMFPEDLVVVLVSMDKESKQWWKTVKELDLRSHPKDEHPYEIQNLRAFNDNTGKMRPEVKRLDKAKGWAGIGYHWVIYQDGSIHEGRKEKYAGAHVRHYNEHAIGICYVGGKDEKGRNADTRTPEQKAALWFLLKDLKESYPNAKIVGHRDFPKRLG